MEDANTHISNFIDICETVKFQDVLRRPLGLGFSFILRNDAKEMRSQTRMILNTWGPTLSQIRERDNRSYKRHTFFGLKSVAFSETTQEIRKREHSKRDLGGTTGKSREENNDVKTSGYQHTLSTLSHTPGLTPSRPTLSNHPVYPIPLLFSPWMPNGLFVFSHCQNTCVTLELVWTPLVELASFPPNHLMSRTT
ncbi:hypothetical protein CR513_35781, partial [Mucuna pruriens]